MMLKGKTFWLVGASEGIGSALARALVAKGANVLLSARSTEKLDALVEDLGRKARALPLDVTSEASVKHAAAIAGTADGIIYCAGSYWPMAATNWNAPQVMAMTDTNYLGALRILGEIVPLMVGRGAGHIVLIGSLAGFSGLPGAIGYGASKAALMHLGLDMQKDLRGSGVTVQIVNPGFVQTRLTGKNNFRMPFIMTTDEAARRIVKAILSGRRVTSFPAVFAMWFKLRRALGL